MLTICSDRDVIVIVIVTATANVIEMTTVAATGRGTGVTDIGMILGKTVQAGDIARAPAIGKIIAAEAVTETSVAGEMTLATGDDEEMILLTPDLPEGMTADAEHRV